ncbi:MAG: hypothetical protein HY960_00875 [Ignavibacteriae bacterium]|nr:hypothetical protein [Ignavibacteriota bacterium]
MKIRLFFIIAALALYVVSATAGGGTCDKSKAKNDSKNCSVEMAKSKQCDDSKMKASNQMDCCKKELKNSKASNSKKDAKNEVVKLAKDSK